MCDRHTLAFVCVFSITHTHTQALVQLSFSFGLCLSLSHANTRSDALSSYTNTHTHTFGRLLSGVQHFFSHFSRSGHSHHFQVLDALHHPPSPQTHPLNPYLSLSLSSSSSYLPPHLAFSQTWPGPESGTQGGPRVQPGNKNHTLSIIQLLTPRPLHTLLYFLTSFPSVILPMLHASSS